jgi:hypothetical protein
MVTLFTSGHTNLVILHTKSSYLRSGSHIFFLFQNFGTPPYLFFHIPWITNFFGCPPTFHNLGGVVFFIFLLLFCFGTTRKTLICGAPFWGSVAHPWCATHIKPLVFITSGARLYVPRLCVLSVAHLSGVRHA